MPGVPLITAGDPAAAAQEEGEAAGAPENEAGAAEDTTAPTTEERHGEGAPGPTIEGERAEAAAGTAPSASAGLEAAPTTEEEVAPAPGDAVAAAVPAGETLRQMLRRRHTRQSLRLRCWPPALLAAKDPRRQRSTRRLRRSRLPKRAPC
jgi:hypothetical protein